MNRRAASFWCVWVCEMRNLSERDRAVNMWETQRNEKQCVWCTCTYFIMGLAATYHLFKTQTHLKAGVYVYDFWSLSHNISTYEWCHTPTSPWNLTVFPSVSEASRVVCVCVYMPCKWKQLDLCYILNLVVELCSFKYVTLDINFLKLNK